MTCCYRWMVIICIPAGINEVFGTKALKQGLFQKQDLWDGEPETAGPLSGALLLFQNGIVLSRPFQNRTGLGWFLSDYP